jgi:glutamate-5-semialdehyde dehydrogenase
MADIVSIGRQARAAGQELAGSSIEARNAALVAIREALGFRAADILAANAADLEGAKTSGLEGAIVKVRL